MRVAIVASFADSLILFRWSLLCELRRRGHEVLAFAPDAGDEVRCRLADIGVTLHDYPLGRTGMNPVADLRSWRALVRAFRRERIDFVVSYTIKPVIYASLAAWLAGTRGIASIVTGVGYAFAGEGLRHRIVNRIARLLYASALKRNQVIFFQNPDDKALFGSLGLLPAHANAIVVNGSGVDVERYAPAPHGNGLPVFLLIARLYREKGVYEFVEAARLVKARYPDATFRIVGPIDSNPTAICASDLEQWKAEGVIEHTGWVSDVRPFLRSASVYVLPSYREGTPRSVLEAMAMGRAVITTDAPGCRETVVDGKNGFLVPVKNAQALARAMEQFITQPALIQTMGRSGRALAVERYDVRKVTAAILSPLGL